ncbi:MAG TPA: SurA N-terminal domain-containing protein, partial [Caulobacteraceae bacterium]|nr:SurA N-terminal domain-containing protein [Caulobacteraceae bacterium]
MLSAIRAFSKSWVAMILFILLLVALIVWGGMGNQFRGVVSSAVVTVGGHELSAQEFDRQFRAQLQQMAQRNGGQAPQVEEAVKAGFHSQMLHALASQLAFSEAITRLG